MATFSSSLLPVFFLIFRSRSDSALQTSGRAAMKACLRSLTATNWTAAFDGTSSSLGFTIGCGSQGETNEERKMKLFVCFSCNWLGELGASIAPRPIKSIEFQLVHQALRIESWSGEKAHAAFTW